MGARAERWAAVFISLAAAAGFGQAPSDSRPLTLGRYLVVPCESAGASAAMAARTPHRRYCLERSPIFDQRDVASAAPAAQTQVELTLRAPAAQRWGELTAKNIGLQVGTVLNGELLSVATIVAPTRRAWISGLTATEQAAVIDALTRGAVAQQSPAPPAPSEATPADGALRVGNGVSPPILIYKQEPEYTEAARAAGIQGAVVLELVVGVDGVPDQIRVVRSLDAGLDAKAIECARGFRFRPAQKQGQPVAIKATLEINFHL